jgi:hypothetical protein
MLLQNSNPTLTNVTINGNTTLNIAGGMGIFDSNPKLTHVIISDNYVSDGYAGGIYFYNSSPILNHVLISGNMVNEFCGGMAVEISNPILNHVTISGNTANDFGGSICLYASISILSNSIIWDNNPVDIYLWSENDEVIITYSDIEGGWEGEGNINIDPLFLDPENGDYALLEGSPCIDAGTSFFEYEGEILVDMSEDEYYGSAPDMGAYEWYPHEPEYQLGDITMDGSVNVQDIVLLVAFIMVTDTPEGDEFNLADLNGDGFLNVLDVVMLVEIIMAEN